MAVLTYAKTDKTYLTSNFRVSEFSCHGKGCCTTTLVDQQLVQYLQKIRDHFGKPITITSGYRCPKHNKNVSGATGSRHAKGQAADIVVKDVKPAEVAKYAESIGIKGIGLYETNADGFFVHIDTRTTKSFWYGQKQAYRSTFGGVPKKEEAAYIKKQFITDVQKACGAGVDGIAGPNTLKKTVTVSATFNNKHAVVKPMQKWLKALGYTEVGTADGEAGPKFASALAHFQMDNGCTATGIAEEWGKTWQKLLGLA